MSSYTQRLAEKGLVTPPKWMPSNVHLEVLMGSQAYQVADDDSDFDIYGFAIPHKEMIFPHLAGEISGFSTPGPRFETWQQHHVFDKDALAGKGRQYDFQMFSIVKFFRLAMENNPNMVDALFVSANCVLHSTQIGQLARDRRRIFLHKGSYHKFRGYAHSQLHKMRERPLPDGKRREDVEKHGYSTKFAYHLVRLLDEAEQILETGDLVLGRNREELKEIRRGEWTEDRVRDYFARREVSLKDLYNRATLRHGPDEPAIRQLLIDCLEQHFGSLSAVIPHGDSNAERALAEIRGVLGRYA